MNRQREGISLLRASLTFVLNRISVMKLLRSLSLLAAVTLIAHAEDKAPTAKKNDAYFQQFKQACIKGEQEYNDLKKTGQKFDEIDVDSYRNNVISIPFM